MNATVNSTREGSRLHTPYENLMPDDLRWSGAGSTTIVVPALGSGCKDRLPLAERFDDTETIIN